MDATTSRARIAELWRGRPFANVALATGSPSGNILVLDVDVKGGKDGLAVLAALEVLHGPLPKSWRTLTPSGGLHLFFVQPIGRRLRNRVNLPVEGFTASGLDVRTDGGSVALPPSRRPDGAYEWAVDPLAVRPADAPSWLLDLIDPPQFRPVPPRVPWMDVAQASLDLATRYICAAVDGECADVARASRGSRNHRLFKASIRLGRFISSGRLPREIAEDELADAAQACGLVADDGWRSVEATIKSGIERAWLSGGS
jgi:hypothetical protein